MSRTLIRAIRTKNYAHAGQVVHRLLEQKQSARLAVERKTVFNEDVDDFGQPIPIPGGGGTPVRYTQTLNVRCDKVQRGDIIDRPVYAGPEAYPVVIQSVNQARQQGSVIWSVIDARGRHTDVPVGHGSTTVKVRRPLNEAFNASKDCYECEGPLGKDWVTVEYAEGKNVTRRSVCKKCAAKPTNEAFQYLALCPHAGCPAHNEKRNVYSPTPRCLECQRDMTIVESLGSNERIAVCNRTGCPAHKQQFRVYAEDPRCQGCGMGLTIVPAEARLNEANECHECSRPLGGDSVTVDANAPSPAADAMRPTARGSDTRMGA